MFVFTAKMTKKKIVAAVILAGAALCLLIWFIPGGGLGSYTSYGGDEAMDAMNAVHGGSVESDADGAEYLTSLGWEVNETPLEKADVIIPKEFDDTYERYNAMQIDNGFDLSKIKGQRVTLYTYEVKNHPSGEEARANLLVRDGKVVGGDICSVKQNGFVHGLKDDGK